MQPEIRDVAVEFTVAGRSVRHDPAKRYGEEIMALLGQVWPVLKGGAIPNDGINRVVYDSDGTVFAGVVLRSGAENLPSAAGLERKVVRLSKHAYWKHVGPYHLLPATGAAMRKGIEAMGLRQGWPMVEVYGHWNSDESKLETETLVAVE